MQNLIDFHEEYFEWFISVWIVIETLKNGFVYGCLIGILAISFSFVYRTTRVFFVSLALCVLTGAYCSIYVYNHLGCHQYIACVYGLIGGSLCGVSQMFLNRHLMNRDVSNSLRLVASLGLYFAIVGLLSLFAGTGIQPPSHFRGFSLGFYEVIITETDIRYVVSAIVISFLLHILVIHSDVGKSIIAIASNRRLFLVLGKNELLILTLVHLISGSLAGLFGAYEGLRNGVDPFGVLPITMAAAVASLLGGHSILAGPLIAGLLIGVIRAATTQVFSDKWLDTIIYGLLFVVAVFGPAKLFSPSMEEERP